MFRLSQARSACVVLFLVGLVSCYGDGEGAMLGEPATNPTDGIPFQIDLEGDTLPFTVVFDDRVSPMLLGVQGPEPRFDAGLVAREMLIADRLSLPVVEGAPQLPTLESESAIYAGRIGGTSVDLVIFPVQVDTEPMIGIYTFDGPLIIAFGSIAPEGSPGYSRATVWDRRDGEADIVYWVPLQPATAVVALEIDGQLFGVVRPRARLAAFDTRGVSTTAELRLIAYDADGTEIDSVEWLSPGVGARN